MAKPNSPLLSLGARGTIGDTLTYQKRGQGTIVRQKPIPKDPYSLNQAYQRWDYRDYAYLWTLLSNAEKQVYRTKASRYHITGFSQWMRENLKTLPNLPVRWHLDERGGAIAYDSSKQGNNGIIVGATPTNGLIDGAYLFDGLNDRITTTPSTPIPMASHFTILAMFYWNGHTAQTSQLIASSHDGFRLGYILPATSRFSFHAVAPYTGGWMPSFEVLAGAWHAVAFTYDEDLPANNSKLFLDGELASHENASGALPTILILELANWNGWTYWFNGIIDHFVILDRTLNQTEIQRHSERRYPP